MDPKDENSMHKDSPAQASAGGAGAQWYVARPGGQRDGPMTFDALKQRAAAGSVTAGDLVWREGMPAWQPARDLLELFRERGPNVPPPVPPVSAGPTDAGGSRRSAGDEPWHLLPPAVERALGQAKFYRIVGRACAVFALIGLLIFTVTFLWQTVTMTWALVLGLGFLVGEATATVLEKLDKIEKLASQPAKAEPAKSTFSDTPPILR